MKRESPRGTALVFAAERALEPVWKTAGFDNLVRTDITAGRDVNLLSDIQRIPFANDSINLLWCHHILEQVRDDDVAMAEILRVLSPAAGCLVVSSGMNLFSETVEYSTRNARELGNYRAYGQDFPERLRLAGFEVEPIDYEFNETDERRYGINRAEKAFICRKPS